MMAEKISIFFLFCVFSRSLAQEGPLIDTPLGQVQGYNANSYFGRTISAFTGIPFAQPPVGDLRFKDPQKLQPWNETYVANKSIVCVQISGSSYVGQEDCLYVNVYSSNENPTPDDNLEVLVYIHGGSFTHGSGIGSSPKLLLERDFVVVTLNYRMGVLGFLCPMDGTISCNLGMKDQVMALQWVRDNIKSFGGNPNSVTIFGQSAGGVSVHYHYFSPLSRGLFHRGYSASGTALNPWAFQRNPEIQFRKVATMAGCYGDTNEELVACLKGFAAEELVMTVRMKETFPPIAPLPPTAEPDVEGAFLTEHPYKMLARGDINDVPWITSCTRDDGASMILSSQHTTDWDYWDQNWKDAIMHLLALEDTVDEENKEEVAQKIRERYIQNEVFDVPSFSKLFTDRQFMGGMERSSLLQAQVGKSPVYDFIFAYEGAGTCSDNYDVDFKAVCHNDDTKFFVGNPVLEGQNEAMIDVYLNLFEVYTKTGQPVMNEINWSPVSDPNVLTFLYIQDPFDISQRRSNNLTQVQFWDSLSINEYLNEP